MSQDTKRNKNKQINDTTRRSSIFKAKKNSNPTKKRASINRQSSFHYLPSPIDITRASSLGTMSRIVPLTQISEHGHEQSNNFVGLNTNLSAQELDKYKIQYYETDSIYQRLLCNKCNCELCKNQSKLPPLKASQSDGIAPLRHKMLLKTRHSAYNINESINPGPSLLFRHKSLSISYSTKNVLLSNHTQHLNYKHSFACLCEKDADLPLISIMSIGAKNDIANFLHILNDINSKMIRINSSLSHKCNAKLFMDKNNNNDVPILMLKRFQNIDSLHPAIRTYHKRLSQPLDFAPKYIIYDNVKEIIDIIKVMSHIVKCFVNGHGMPFQIDLVIIPPKTQKKNVLNVSYNDEDDEDDDDDVEVDTDDKEDENDDFEVVTDDEDDEKQMFCNDIGDLFANGLLQEHSDHFYDKCIVLDRTERGIKAFKKHLTDRKINIFRKSTQNGRYVIVVDRAGKHTHKFKETAIRFGPENEAHTDVESDYMYFFQPPKPFGDIIGYNRLIEILHLNTLQCLLPKINTKLNVNNAYDDEKINGRLRTEKEEFYGAKDLCDGKILCVSFHVLSEDEIRCYLYVDQKYLRIDLDEHGQDLEDVLKCYVQSTTSGVANRSNCKRSEDSKYNKFAFHTTDTKFDNYFKWVQERLEQQHKRSSSHKQEKPLDIGGNE